MGETLPGRSVIDWPSGVTVYKPGKCFNGYTVVVPFRSEKLFLVDMAGRVVHVWNAHPRELRQSEFLERLPNGNWITFNQVPARQAEGAEGLDPFRTRGMRQELLELDWEGNVVWQFGAPEGSRLHHDMQRLATGNTLVLTATTKTVPPVSPKEIEENSFLEVTPEGEVVWEWNTSDHYDEFAFDQRARDIIAASGGDCYHTNTAEALPGSALGAQDERFRKGNVLSCQRQCNLVYIVDRRTARLTWQWGNAKGGLVGPHHPTMLANGNILIYDNGGSGGHPARSRFYTRLVEIDPVTCEVVWEYQHEPHVLKEKALFFSHSWGAVQRLPNGNTFSLDCHNAAGRDRVGVRQPVLLEPLDAEGIGHLPSLPLRLRPRATGRPSVHGDGRPPRRAARPDPTAAQHGPASYRLAVSGRAH
jgi:hypothetical protein